MVVTTFQYWQCLYVFQTGEAAQDSNGSWAGGAGAWQPWSACREETNGRGNQIQTQDGRTITFSSLIQLPVGTERVDEGTRVIVTDGEVDPEDLLSDDYIRDSKASGLIRADGTCLKFDSGRLHCRLWV